MSTFTAVILNAFLPVINIEDVIKPKKLIAKTIPRRPKYLKFLSDLFLFFRDNSIDVFSHIFLYIY